MRLSFAIQVVPVAVLSLPVLLRTPARDFASLYPWPAVSLGAAVTASLITIFGTYALFVTPVATLRSLLP